jgi:hypothetical protein
LIIIVHFTIQSFTTIDDEKSDFDVENRESVNVVHMNTASKTLHQDLETDIKTSQEDDPEFDGEDPDLNDNDLTFALNKQFLHVDLLHLHF